MKSRLLLRPIAATVLTLALSACGFIRPVADPATEQAAEPVADPAANPAIDGQAAAPEAAAVEPIPGADAVATPDAVPAPETAVTPEAPATPPAGVPETVVIEKPPPRTGWLARFFWSPEYCDKNRGSKEVQCGVPRQGFVLRDLVHVVNDKDVDECPNGSLLMSPEMLAQMARFTKNKVETRTSWRLYGRCSGLSEVDYASWSEFVDRRMSWPENLVPGGRDVSTTAAEIVATLAQNNPGLTAETVVLQCNRAWLKSVDLCLDENFHYDKASCPRTSSCGSSIKVLGKP